MSEDNGVQISFDDECRIRVLDPEQFKHSETLEEECRGFVDKIREFNTSVHTVVEVLQENAARIDKEKLRAIGQRNKVRSQCVSDFRGSQPREVPGAAQGGKDTKLTAFRQNSHPFYPEIWCSNPNTTCIERMWLRVL